MKESGQRRESRGIIGLDCSLSAGYSIAEKGGGLDKGGGRGTWCVERGQRVIKRIEFVYSLNMHVIRRHDTLINDKQKGSFKKVLIVAVRPIVVLSS